MRILFCILCFFGFLFGQVSIASFNVHNLFDAKEDGTEYSDFLAGGKQKWNKIKYEKKIAKVASDIKNINADIILLLEIENDGVLKELAKICGYEYRIFAKGNDNAPIGLGFLSKRKIKSFKEFKVPRVLTRPILQINIDDAGRNISIFGAHFPAMKNSFEKRLSAAKTMQRAVRGAKNSIILGDLNSDYGKDFLLNSLNNDYINIWDNIKNKRSYKGKLGGAIDHIMVSKNLYKNSKVKFEIFNTTSSDHLALGVRL